jgi:hypothetical protein
MRKQWYRLLTVFNKEVHYAGTKQLFVVPLTTVSQLMTYIWRPMTDWVTVNNELKWVSKEVVKA